MADHIERLKWRIADLVNRLRGQCWADLVSWVLDSPRSRDEGLKGRLPWRPIPEGCRKDLARAGCCYCGKLMSAEMREQLAAAAAAPAGLAGWCEHGVGMLDDCGSCTGARRA